MTMGRTPAKRKAMPRAGMPPRPGQPGYQAHIRRAAKAFLTPRRGRAHFP